MKKLHGDSDAAIERQLRDALEARLAPLPSGAPGNACLDAQTLAAWADDGLGARERAAAEAHAADCSRCQALLAAMIRTAEPAADAKAWWHLPAMRWLVPLTAAATAVAVWSIVPSRPSLQPGDQVVPGVPGVSDTARAPASSVDRLSESRPVAQSPREDAKQADASAKDKASSTAANALSSAPTDAATGRLAASPSAAAAAPPQREVQAPQAAAPAPSTAAQESFGRALRKEATISDIVSADSGGRWRIIPGGAVQRSTDSGSTWETQATGVSVTLVAGAAPSSSVCWLVGPGGIVLLQTDGRSWRRIAFPEATDLASVRASDERTATVTTADGRMFSTVDGGLTWTRFPRA